MKSLCRYLLLALLLGTGPVALADDDDPGRAELSQLLAPVALYPDSVLSHLLIASTYPLEVVEAHRWRRRQGEMDGQVAVAGAKDQGWDPSVQALVAFPGLLERMSEDLDWTRQLGEAFLRDEAAALAAIQDLRRRAREAGHLESSEQQQVVVEQQTVIIEPRQPDIIYLPYYRPKEVYGGWQWNRHPPRSWQRPGRGYWHGPIFWSFATRINRGDFYFSSFHWRRGHTVVIDHHHRPRMHFSSARSVVRYREARRWRHNPLHRDGAAYHHRELRKRYGLPGREERQETPLLKRSPAQVEQQLRAGDSPTRLERGGGPNRVLRLQQGTGKAREVERHQREAHTRPPKRIETDRRRPHQGRTPARVDDNQQNFQRSMRDRLKGAREKPSITDRARSRDE